MESVSWADDTDFHCKWLFGSLMEGGWEEQKTGGQLPSQGTVVVNQLRGGEYLSQGGGEGSNSRSALEANFIFKLECCYS